MPLFESMFCFGARPVISIGRKYNYWERSSVNCAVNIICHGSRFKGNLNFSHVCANSKKP